MKIVLDTNVVVSGLMTPTGVAAAVLARVRAGHLLVVYDARILTEYREVLARPRLAIPAVDALAFVEAVERAGVAVHAAPRCAFESPHPDDQSPFSTWQSRLEPTPSSRATPGTSRRPAVSPSFPRAR